VIAFLRGIVVERAPGRVVVEVNGVGYEVLMPVASFSQLPSRPADLVSLRIHTHVREDALQLYGFFAAAEKLLFEKLIGVNGIGPKLGLAILSGLPAAELAQAIRSGDLARLTAIPGVGKKTAERLVMELRDKLPAGPEPATPAAAGPGDDVVSALVNLGYARAAAEKTLAAARAAGVEMGFEPLFKACMRLLGAG
jgi:Holliday junction DNA helicase RuvA